MMGSVFAMQGFGQFGAAVIALIVTAGFRESLESASSVAKCSGVCQLAVDKMWRTVIGFGAVPACIALYFRLTIPETPRYTFDIQRDIIKGGEDIDAYIEGRHEGHPDEVQRSVALKDHSQALRAPKSSWADFWAYFSHWQNALTILGTAGSWFFLDIGGFIPFFFFFFSFPFSFSFSVIPSSFCFSRTENSQPSMASASITRSFLAPSAGRVEATYINTSTATRSAI
jgi:hypothetical protein